MVVHSMDLAGIKSLSSKLCGQLLHPGQKEESNEKEEVTLNQSDKSFTTHHPSKTTSLVGSEKPHSGSGGQARTSFESVREGGPIQSFIVSSQPQQGHISQVDGTNDDETGLKGMMTTSTLLHSPSLSQWRADLRHVIPSQKSGFDVKTEELGQFDSSPTSCDGRTQPSHTSHVIQRVPYEVLGQILTHLLLDTPPSSTFVPRNADLLSCMMTCRELHAATLNVLYRHATIPHSRIFAKMFNVISNCPSLGELVRRLDFSHYSVIGLGRTRRANSEIQNLTSQNLATCLQLMPKLREFLVHEHIDDVLNAEVLKTLFSMPFIQAIDFCACSSLCFVQSFDAAVTNNEDLPHILPNLQRISLHECSTLQAPSFETLLPRLPNLTHLEVSHTLITNKALTSIPETARLTHLNLSKCMKLSGEVVVDFIIHHPAAKHLEYLSLMSDATRHQLLEAQDLERLLTNLPPTLRSLNINGSDLNSRLFPLLLPLRTQLDELSIAQSKLTLSDINSLFPKTSSIGPDLPTQPSTIQYIDLTSISALNRVAIFNPSNFISKTYSLPLSVIEISDESLISGLRSRYSITGNGLGWVVKESGRRAWLVRDMTDGANSSDDGVAYAAGDDEESEDSAYRGWKWGAKWWGMRKVPVARQDVGGMYGHYMFKA